MSSYVGSVRACGGNILLLLLFFVPVSTCLADRVSTFTLPNGMDVEIVEAPFNVDEASIDMYRIPKGIEMPRSSTGEVNRCICRIDKAHVYGSFCEPPRKYIKELNVWHEGNKYSLPVTNPRMYDAWRPLIQEYTAHLYFSGECFEKNYCVFRGRFSDASGSYVAEWLVLGDNTIRTALYDTDVGFMEFFREVDANISTSILPDY